MSDEAERALAYYRAMAANLGCSERVRSASASVALAIEAHENILAREARIPTSPSGTPPVKPTPAQ